jgi:hypothetical protein
MRYFYTSSASIPIPVNNSYVKWEMVGVFAGMLVGYLKTEDQATIDALIGARGTKEIDQKEFEAVSAQKKTALISRRSTSSRQEQKPSPQVPRPFAVINEQGRVGHVVDVPLEQPEEAMVTQTSSVADVLKLSPVSSPDILPKPGGKKKR